MNLNAEIRVLIVEDEPIILRHVMRKVEELGAPIHVVGGVESSQKAMALLESLKPDILLTDIEMAGRNGLELIRYAKQKRPDLRTVILSGYSNFEYAQTALRYGADDYLLKPIDVENLKETFGRIAGEIEQSRASEEPLELGEETLTVRMKQFLEEHFNQSITMADLSERFNYAPSYLSRIFKKEYGMPPIHYQMKLRMRRAKDMLSHSSAPNIKEIAAAVGYDDPRYFSRIFRQFERITPTEWQAKEQKP